MIRCRNLRPGRERQSSPPVLRTEWTKNACSRNWTPQWRRVCDFHGVPSAVTATRHVFTLTARHGSPLQAHPVRTSCSVCGRGRMCRCSVVRHCSWRLVIRVVRWWWWRVVSTVPTVPVTVWRRSVVRSRRISTTPSTAWHVITVTTNRWGSHTHDVCCFQ